MFKLNSKNNIATKFQEILKEHKWMFFVFILWAITYTALSEGILTRRKTITVIGSSTKATQNQVAAFNVNINTDDADKLTAVEETNKRSGAVIDAIKSFGIPENDIKTANTSIYQQQEYINGKYVNGNWYAGVGVEITLRNVDKATELTDLLSSLDIDSFYGPNFSIDVKNLDEIDLLNASLIDAHNKATSIAKATNKKLGKIVSLIENGASYTGGMYQIRTEMRGGSGGGAAEMLLGTSEVYKNITVTYEIK